MLCRACFEALPEVGWPCCARCGLPTAVETFMCEECKNVDFGFKSARAPLRYVGAGEKIVHALKYGGHTRVVEKVAAPLMLGVLDGGMRFNVLVPVPLHRSRLRKRGAQPGRALGTRRRPADERTLIRYTRSRAQHAGSGRALGRREAGQRYGRVLTRELVVGRILQVDGVFPTGATMSACAGTLLRESERRARFEPL